MNHDRHLLKSFMFLSDCSLQTGPHHYISGSVQDRRVDGKTYYSEEEIHAVYPPASGQEIISVVPAGTIMLEDTRDLHKAGIPQEGYRDLGYATFLPPIAFKRRKPQYHIGRKTYESLPRTSASIFLLSMFYRACLRAAFCEQRWRLGCSRFPVG